MEPDTYKTISKPSNEILFKDKKSKFFAYAFPFQNKTSLPNIISGLKTKHKKANHFCFAYQIGTVSKNHRVNDDGEPNNSAGMPIYGQIKSLDVTNILIVVVRYFGGTKLGVGGLINAYRNAAKLALENSEIVVQTIQTKFTLSFDYNKLNYVMNTIKINNFKIISQKLDEKCELQILVRKNETNSIHEKFSNVFGITVNEF